MANDKEADVKARGSADNLIGEIAAAIMKLYHEIPAMRVIRHELPSNLALPYSLQYKTTMEEQEEEMKKG
jgi:hypothetical protein